MSSFISESLSDKEKNDLMQQIKQEVAIATTHELLSKMTEKCFKKCIVKPGISLDSSEQKCVAMCMDRYMETYNLVLKTYSSRVQREFNKM
ncbi:mitochondrial import inner membrane translocase subunit Tim13 [Megachile rotundata]|uniref:mitochondrial import inner membrane translocase subunit Tim13 n=1 Tax=Megachile rotundata TaxID=143995 RepID=UPI000258EA79|nr:PREDICTED: mitochondrial import inner membrane translocase subunit Tim13-like [Megachile rotundata]